MKKKNLLIISYLFPIKKDSVSGSFIFDQVKMLEKNYNILVISPVPYTPKIFTKFKNKWQEYYQKPVEKNINGIKIFRPRYLRLPSKYFLSLSAITMLFSLKKNIKKVINFEPNIIHGHSTVPDGYVAYKIAKLLKINSIVTFHGSDINIYPKKYYARRIIVKVIKNIDQIITVSKDLKKSTKNITRPKNKIVTIYNGVNNNIFYPNNLARNKIRNKLKISRKAKIVLFVGSLTKNKGFDIAYESFKIIQNKIPNSYFIIIGSGPLKQIIKKSKNIIYMGQIERNRISDYYNASDCLILPSKYEGLPTVVVEAMACGKPCVTSDVNGIPEIVINKINGYIVNNNSTELYAKKVIKLFSDRKLYNNLSKNCLRIVYQYFDSQKNIKRIEEIYQKNIIAKKVCVLSTVHIASDTRIFEREICALRDAGYKVVLIAKNDRNEIINGIKIFALPKKINRIKRILVLPFFVYKIAKKQKADIYHFHDPELMFVGYLLKKFTKAKVVCDIHEDYVRDIYSKNWVPKSFRKLISIIFKIVQNLLINKFDAVILAWPRIVDNLKIRKNQYTVINNYPKLFDFQKVKKLTNKIKVIYCGDLIRARGIKEIVLASKYFNPKKVEFQIIGSFSDESFRQEIVNLAEWKNIKYFGRLPHNLAMNKLFQADIGIVYLWPEPNHLYAIPNKIFEYMMAGLPVVASDIGYYKKILKKTKAGICIKPKDCREIVRVIKYLINHPKTMKKMSKNGRKIVEEKYNWNIEKEKLIKLYSKL